jgi:hypothetical protein
VRRSLVASAFFAYEFELLGGCLAILNVTYATPTTDPLMPSHV